MLRSLLSCLRCQRPVAMLMAFMLVAPGVGAAVVVNPGETVSLAPEDCASASGYRVRQQDPWDPCVLNCEADCSPAAGSAGASLSLPNSVGMRYVTSTIYGEFTIEDSAGTQAQVSATIDYDINWKGAWTLGGIFTNYNDAMAQITVYLYDVTDNNKVIKKTEPPVHTESAASFVNVGPEVGAGQDIGSTSNSLLAQVRRGHTYRVALTLHLTGRGLDNANIMLDYISGDNGLYWNQVGVTVSPDLAGQITQLENRVTALEEEITHLQSELAHHTHTYLTGRGEGHNNTEAQTSEAIIMSEDEVPDSTLTWLPDDSSKGQTLPRKSVLLTNYPNPFNPTTTILYSLPEAAQVRIVVYNTLGQEVMTLVDRYVDAGEHMVEMDASDLASGVYYYRLTTPQYAETRKLLLIK